MHSTRDSDLQDLQAVRRAILVVDLVESVRLMQSDETEVIRRWRQFVAEVSRLLREQYGGRVVKHLGDGMLVEFSLVSGAIAAAFEMHRLMDRLTQGMPAPTALRLRAGLHVGDVRIDETDVFGHNVNLAARLASLALPGGTVVSPEIMDELVPGLHAGFEDMGECWLKGLAHSVRAYRAEPAKAGFNTRQPASRHDAAPAGSLLPRLAVLDIAAQAGDEVMGSLISDEIAGLLTVNHGVELVSRMSTRKRGSQGQAAVDLLRHLQASYGLCGSCSRVGTRVVLRLELLAAGPNTVMWTGGATVSVEDFVSAPADALQALCSEAMAAAQAHEARRARTLPIASLESHALLIGGVTLMHRLSRASFERGRELLEAVSERAPRHPDAHAWLARWHLMQAFQGWSDDAQVSSSRANAAARRALDLDTDCSLALTVAGMVQTYSHRRLDEGERLYRQALQANPNDALAWLLKGTLHGFRGEGAAALADTRRALALSPIDPHRYYYDALAASAALSAGEYAQAVQLAERSLHANSLHASTLRVLAIAHMLSGDEAAARVQVDRMLVLEPTFTVQRFLERAPGADYPIGRSFADALRQAGVPA